MTKLKYFVLITLLTTFSSFADAEVKGIGTVEYERRLDPPEEQLALKAKLNALRIYTENGVRPSINNMSQSRELLSLILISIC